MPAFADTNVVVYAFAKDDAKIAVAEEILEKQPTISVQVIIGDHVFRETRIPALIRTANGVGKD